MVEWHHWFNGHEFEWTQGDSEGQGSLCAAVHGVTKSHIRLSNWTAMINITPLDFSYTLLLCLGLWNDHTMPSSATLLSPSPLPFESPVCRHVLWSVPYHSRTLKGLQLFSTTFHVCSEFCVANTLHHVLTSSLRYEATTSVGLSCGSTPGHSGAATVIWPLEISACSKP